MVSLRVRRRAQGRAGHDDARGGHADDRGEQRLMPMYAYKGVATERQDRRPACATPSRRSCCASSCARTACSSRASSCRRAARRRRSRTRRRAGCRATSISAACSAASRRSRSRRSRARWRRCCARASRSPRRSARSSSRSTNVRLKTPISEVRTAVNEGSSLADALAKHPKLFDELFVSMVRAGEVAGNLDEVLTRLADFLESVAEAQVEDPGRDDLSDRDGRRRRRHHGGADDQGDPEITQMFTQQGKTLPLNTRFLIAIVGLLRPLHPVAASLGTIVGDHRCSCSGSGLEGRQAGVAPRSCCGCRCSASWCARSTSAGSRARSARCCSRACRCCARSTPRSRSSATC